MELAISIAINVVLGAVLLALLHWKGRPDLVRLAGAEQAIDLFRRHFPDAAGVVTVAADGRSALIDLQPSGVGLLQRQGRRWIARTLASGELSSARVDLDGAINLTFADFGWPRARVPVADANSRATWMARLDSLIAQRTSRRSSDLRHA
jgi:hypothetical protein